MTKEEDAAWGAIYDQFEKLPLSEFNSMRARIAEQFGKSMAPGMMRQARDLRAFRNARMAQVNTPPGPKRDRIQLRHDFHLLTAVVEGRSRDT